MPSMPSQCQSYRLNIVAWLLYPTEIALEHVQKWLPKSNTAAEVAVGMRADFWIYSIRTTLSWIKGVSLAWKTLNTMPRSLYHTQVPLVSSLSRIYPVCNTLSPQKSIMLITSTVLLFDAACAALKQHATGWAGRNQVMVLILWMMMVFLRDLHHACSQLWYKYQMHVPRLSHRSSLLCIWNCWNSLEKYTYITSCEFALTCTSHYWSDEGHDLLSVKSSGIVAGTSSMARQFYCLCSPPSTVFCGRCCIQE